MSEQSLVNLGATINKLAIKLQRLDKDIVLAVREQTRSQAAGSADLARAKESVLEIVKKSSEIKKKTEDSEAMATKICGRMRSLDNGKRNLTAAIRMLKRLQIMGSISPILCGTKTRSFSRLHGTAETTVAGASLCRSHAQTGNHRSALPRIQPIQRHAEGTRDTERGGRAEKRGLFARRRRIPRVTISQLSVCSHVSKIFCSSRRVSRVG